jgi:hypothetical protein
MLNLNKAKFFKEIEQCLRPRNVLLPRRSANRLLELYVRRDEARRDDNWQEARHLQHQIEEIAAERNELLAGRREE